MPRPLLRVESVIYIYISILRFCSSVQPFCSASIYGIPNYQDCLSALHLMPFALRPSTDAMSTHLELWAEPQYLLPPFNGVINRYRPLPINQMPKIWRYSTLNHSYCESVSSYFSSWRGIALYRHALKIGYFRHVPPCGHELRRTRGPHRLEQSIQYELESRPGSDAENFRMWRWQVPNADWPERRICTFYQ